VESEDVEADLDHVLLTEAQLHERIAQIAAQIDTDYAGGPRYS